MDPRSASAGNGPLAAPIRAWGIGASILWGLAAVAAQYAVMFAFISAFALLAGRRDELRTLSPFSPLVWLGTILATPAQIAVLAWAVRMRGGFAAYMALRVPDRREWIFGAVLLAGLVVAFDGLTIALGRDVVPPFLVEAYRTAKAAGALATLFIAIVIAAPIWEELLFRGFLFRGFQSRLGPGAAVVLTALTWALLHVQYDWFGIAQVFCIGLFFGWLRLRSGSTLLVIPLHMATNLVAALETIVMVEWMS